MADVLAMNDLEHRLVSSGDFPSVPSNLRRVLDLLGSGEPDPVRLAEAISRDPTLANGIQDLIRSPAGVTSRELGSVEEAVLYVGPGPVGSLLLSLPFLAHAREDRRSSDRGLHALWRTSLVNALAARRLAQEVGGWDPADAFLAGLAADCGTRLLYRKVPEYPHLFGAFRKGTVDLLELERTRLSTDHARVGSLVLGTAGFPAELGDLVRTHHDPEGAESPGIALRARILSAAWLCARCLTVQGFCNEVLEIDRTVGSLLGLPPVVVRSIVSELPDEARETATVLELPLDGQPQYEELRERARQSASRFALQAPGRLGDPNGDPPTYDRILFTDLRKEVVAPLPAEGSSGLLSRESFERVLSAFHERARQARSSIGLLLIEVEDLKHRPADGADEWIRGLRVRIESQTRTSDVCGRFAENQIAVLIAGCPASDLEHVAERIRVSLELSLSSEERPTSEPVAIGVAGTTPHLDGLDVQALLRLACGALDRARETEARIAVEG